MWVFDDGGREAAAYRGKADDCVTRAIAIATGVPYGIVYGELMAAQEAWLSNQRRSKRQKLTRSGNRRSASPRDGVMREVYEPWLINLGWVWTPTMRVGSGCTVHLTPDELPAGKIICRVSKHMVAVIDGVAHDTYDPTRDGTRCVYGYFQEQSWGNDDD